VGVPPLTFSNGLWRPAALAAAMAAAAALARSFGGGEKPVDKAIDAVVTPGCVGGDGEGTTVVAFSIGRPAATDAALLLLWFMSPMPANELMVLMLGATDRTGL